jgi:RimJ/RimL family protein N-acetyltransferase
MQIQLTSAQVRSWQLSDAESLAVHANNRNIWRNLRDAFPHPYTVADANAFIRSALAQVPETRLAIAVDGQAVGGIGFVLHDDVERVSAEIGYWLGEAFWGRGIMTEALPTPSRCTDLPECSRFHTHGTPRRSGSWKRPGTGWRVGSAGAQSRTGR